MAWLAAARLFSAALAGASLFDDFDYSNPQYWERRYSKSRGEAFEWYGVRWPVLNVTLKTHVRKGDRILHLGTGNSPIPEEMYHDGFRRQVAVDISRTVISQMQQKLGHLAPDLEFAVADALRTGYDDASFDVVLEKGAMEAVGAERDCPLADEGCEMSALEKALALEAFRLLKPGGVFVSVADEFKPFPELKAAGLSRVETTHLTEKDGLPVPKSVFVGSKVAAGGGQRRDVEL